MAVTPTRQEVEHALRVHIAVASGIPLASVTKLHQDADMPSSTPFARFVPVTIEQQGQSSVKYGDVNDQTGRVTERRVNTEHARYQIDFFGDGSESAEYMARASGYDAMTAARAIVPTFNWHRAFDLRQIDFDERYRYGNRWSLDVVVGYTRSTELNRPFIDGNEFDLSVQFNDDRIYEVN